MPYIEHRGATLHFDYFPSTSDRYVVLQHPLCSDPGCYDDTSLLQQLLDHQYNVILPTSIGHGQSSSPGDPERYALVNRAADVIAILDELNIEQVAYVGYSMGTWIGCGLLAHHPERILGASLGGFDLHKGANNCGIPLRFTGSQLGVMLLMLYSLWSESRINFKTSNFKALQRCFTALYEPMPELESVIHNHIPLHFWSTQRDLYTPHMQHIANTFQIPIDILDGHHFTASTDDRFVPMILQHIHEVFEQDK